MTVKIPTLGHESRTLEASARRSERAKQASETSGQTVRFPPDLVAIGRRHAMARDISTNELFRQIVEAVLTDNIVDAVLDDRHSEAA